MKNYHIWKKALFICDQKRFSHPTSLARLNRNNLKSYTKCQWTQFISENSLQLFIVSLLCQEFCRKLALLSTKCLQFVVGGGFFFSFFFSFSSTVWEWENFSSRVARSYSRLFSSFVLLSLENGVSSWSEL
jgi:hypothetical protein